MKLMQFRKHLLVFGVLSWLCILSDAFEILEKLDIFRNIPCPAFLMFENVAYLADMSFELPCSCKPEEVAAVVWYYQKGIGSQRTTVLTDFNGTSIVDAGTIRQGSNVLLRFSIRMFSLIVFKAQKEDTGHYICGTRQGQFFYGYDIDVQSTDDALLLFQDNNQHPMKDQVEKNFKAFTTFWDWTKCDRCDVRGEQVRIGLCYVESKYLFTRYRKTNDDVASCGSAAVPRRFRKLMITRKTEVIIRSCTVPCLTEKEKAEKPPKKSFLANALSSVISKLGLDRVIPSVPTQFYKQAVGSGLIISCPGARPEHAVAWDKDNMRLYRTKYLTGVNRSMRVFIDHGNQLHIRFTYLEDMGLYHCWLEGKLAAGFRLSIVYKNFRIRTFNDPETVYAVKAILVSYFLISILFVTIHCCKCCCYIFKCC